MKQSMKASLDVLKSLGAGGKALVARLSGVKDPLEMHRSIQASLKEVAERRSDVSARLDTAHNEIVRKKKQRDAAAGVRKKTLESELTSLVGTYQALQRRLEGLLESERVMNLALLKLEEDQDNRIPKLSEDTLDEIIDIIEESADSRDDMLDASRDLESAGVRTRTGPQVDLDDLLAGFDEEIEPDPPEDQPEPATPSADPDEPEPEKRPEEA